MLAKLDNTIIGMGLIPAVILEAIMGFQEHEVVWFVMAGQTLFVAYIFLQLGRKS